MGGRERERCSIQPKDPYQWDTIVLNPSRYVLSIKKKKVFFLVCFGPKHPYDKSYVLISSHNAYHFLNSNDYIIFFLTSQWNFEKK